VFTTSETPRALPWITDVPVKTRPFVVPAIGSLNGGAGLSGR
jgi:hypothetical protein